MRRLTARERGILTITLILAVGYIGYYGIFLSTNAVMKDLDIRIEAGKKKYLRNLRLIEKANQKQHTVKAYLRDFQLKESNEKVISSMLSMIEEVAGQYQVKLSDQKPRPVGVDEFITRFPVSLTIDSAFLDVLEFINQLQSKPYYFSVDEVRFDKGSRRKSGSIKTRLIISKIFINNTN